MPHALTAHVRLGHLYSTAVADNAFVPDLLILATVALPVFAGPEDLLTEQAVLFRLQRPVIDGLRLCNLSS